MKAARWHRARDVRIEDIPEPSPSSGEVKIEIACTGICGTDLHNYNAGPIGIPVDAAHPLTGGRAPVVMGHEFSGTVVAIGAGVTKVRPGDRVTVEPILVCGQCETCRRGLYNLCELRGFHGASGGGGAYASHTVVQERMVHRLPDALSFEQGALVEPAAVALHALRTSRFKVGDRVAVFGAGTIGLMLVEALRLAGASAIHVVEPSPERAGRARERGADATIDPADSDPVAAIRAATPGGVDIAFEVTAVPMVLQQAIDVTRPGGEAMVISIWEGPAAIDFNAVVRKEISVKGSIAYRDVFPIVIDLMTKGHFRAEGLVTKRIALTELVEQGFEELMRDRSHIKIMVRPSA